MFALFEQKVKIEIVLSAMFLNISETVLFE